MPDTGSLFTGTGRPTSRESQQRKARFLCLIAEGADAVQARRQARIDADTALRIVTETDYLEIVRAIRSSGTPLAVTVEAGEQDANLAA